jgi:Sulfotransferase domain
MDTRTSESENSQLSQASEHPTAPRSGIVWLASYPKSGNTWTRAFLHSLIKAVSGEADTQHINALGRFTAGLGGRELYAKILGYEPTNEHRNEIAAVRHEVQRRAAEHYDGLLFIKTHQALVIDRGTTTINFDVTAGAIYIVRNPLDVAISYAHHIGCTIDKVIEIMGTPNGELPVTELQVNEVYGTWSQHVLSWTRKPHRAIHVMRYEDMLAEPAKTFGGLARHLLFEPTERQLADAIKASSFSELRAQEDKDGFRERSEKAERFFREGRAGQWKEILTPQQIDRIVNDHGEQMTRFGYLPN